MRKFFPIMVFLACMGLGLGLPTFPLEAQIPTNTPSAYTGWVLVADDGLFQSHSSGNSAVPSIVAGTDGGSYVQSAVSSALQVDFVLAYPVLATAGTINLESNATGTQSSRVATIRYYNGASLVYTHSVPSFAWTGGAGGGSWGAGVMGTGSGGFYFTRVNVQLQYGCGGCMVRLKDITLNFTWSAATPTPTPTLTPTLTETIAYTSTPTSTAMPIENPCSSSEIYNETLDEIYDGKVYEFEDVELTLNLLTGMEDDDMFMSDSGILEYEIVADRPLIFREAGGFTLSSYESRLTARTWSLNGYYGDIFVYNEAGSYPRVWSGKPFAAEDPLAPGVHGYLLASNQFYGMSYTMYMAADNDSDGDVAITAIGLSYAIPTDCPYYRPLVAGYADTEIINNSLNFSDASIQYSVTQSAYVHAAADGIISYIRHATNDDCDELLDQTAYWFYAPDDNLGHCHFAHPVEDEHALIGVDVDNLQATIITLQTPDYTFEYFVDDPVSGLDIGTQVTGGCVLGEVANTRTALTGLSELGIVAIAAFDSEGQFNANDIFVLEPSEAAPFCAEDYDRPYDSSLCLNFDTYLEDPSQWNGLEGGFWARGGGLLLEGGMSIGQVMNLNSNLSYQVAVGLFNYSGSELRLKITLGDETASPIVQNLDSRQLLTLDAETPNPDLGLFYSLSIENLSLDSLFITFICVKVSNDEDDIPETPTACYLVNYNFDTLGSGWDISGDYYWSLGEVRLDEGAIPSQEISLPEGDYTVTVYLGYLYSSLEAPDETGQVEMDFTFDSVSYELGTVSYRLLADLNAFELSAQFSVEETTTSDLSIEFDLASPEPTDVTGIALRSVCISEFDDGGGIGPAPGGGGSPAPVDCGIVSAPQNRDSVPEWIQWQWHNQSKFFRCELMVLLNKMYKLMFDTYKIFIWNVRWWMVFAAEAVNWFDSQVAGWLGGHFANMTAASLATSNSSGGCDNFWCFLSELFTGVIEDILAPVIDAVLGWIDLILFWLLGIITLMLGFIFSLLAVVITSVFFALQLLATLFLAYQDATPVPIAGLPDCTVTSPNENFWCAALWTLQNTVWGRTSHVFTAVSAGEILTSLMVGMGSINLAIWVVITIRRIFLDAAKAV